MKGCIKAGKLEHLRRHFEFDKRRMLRRMECLQMDIIIATMWPEEKSLPVIEIKTETDNSSPHLEEKKTMRTIRKDQDQMNNNITIPTGWKGWWKRKQGQ
jgi:hypothetical protein